MRKHIRNIIFILILNLCLGSFAFADSYEGTVNPQSVLLIDADSGEVLYSKNPEEQVYPASTTKILTCLTALDYISNPEATVTVSDSAVAGIVEGDDSTLEPMLQPGEEMSYRDLLYGLMLISGNDCAAVLAESTAGSISAFVDAMNAKAAELGMSSSHFNNPHGVQDSEHYTTAMDMAKLCAAALDNEEFMAIVATKNYTIPATNCNEARELETSNRLLNEQSDLPGTAYEYATGLKTGYTPTAGGCLCASAEKDGRRLLCLIYNDSSSEQQERWLLAKDLFEFGFGSGTENSGSELTEETTEDDQNRDNGISRGIRVVLLLLLAALFFACIFLLISLLMNPRRGLKGMLLQLGILCFIFLLLFLILLIRGRKDKVSEEIVETPTETEVDDTVSNDYSRWGLEWNIFTGDTAVESYSRSPAVSFDNSLYASFPGVATFRGNNYRDDASYGLANAYNHSVNVDWTVDTSALPTASGTSSWTGSGWTGQPLVAQWSAETRAVMNLYDSKKAKDGLVEVIYATLDGNIYFLDAEDGSYTRDPLYLGMAFKGAGALDPRGWPLLYVGSGDETADEKRPRMYIISLIDGSILYEYGFEESLSIREDNDNWCAFDSSPLIDAATDTLFWPGECGILYSIHLNTVYDESGSISISPDEPVKARYNTARSSYDSYWYGFESSAVINSDRLYITENGGMVFCVDVNTMSPVWAQDTGDDNNSTPVLYEESDGNYALFTAPSLHWTADENSAGRVCIYKLDAETGEILWTRGYDCYTVSGVSGGVQSTPLLGREGTVLEDIILYTIARTPDINQGLLVALDARNGCELWRMNMDNYTWSSPVALYNDDGSAQVLVFDSVGNGFLLNAETGEIMNTFSVGSLVEASPVVYNNQVFIGTRGQKIYGLSFD